MSVITGGNTIDSISKEKNAPKSETDKKALASNFDEFVKLLLTQLKNQDPTEPLDTNQFTQQLVQFSQVEQTVATNSNLEKLISLTQGSQINNAVSYIGKTVDALGNKGNLFGDYAEFTYELPQAAKKVTLTVTDSTGQVVFSGNGDTRAGKNIVLWDGINSFNGTKMPDGVYSIAVAAKDADGKEIKATTYTTGTITSVDLQDGELKLSLGDIKIDMDDVKTIRPAAIPTDTAGD